ncbi:MAG: hypothetical protein RR063_11005 [Anaerovoracaceae bacterium]
MNEKQFEFPSMTISIPFLMDVVCRCINGAQINNLIHYTGKSKTYVKGALTAAITLGMVITEDQENYSANKECSSILTSMPTEEIKTEVFRIWLQQFDPFILFLRYMAAGDSSTVAAKKMYSFYAFNRPVDNIEKVLVSWGKSVGILDNNNQICIADFNPTPIVNSKKLQTDSEYDGAIRLYIVEALSSEVYAWLEHAEIEEIVASYKKRLTDPRSAIECAGRAFEDVLRRISVMKNLDAKKQNGISQVANFLYSHRDSSGNISSSILPKQYNISQAIGDIRNMAGHSKEAKTLERWEITDSGALALTQLTLTMIRSLYYYTKKGTYAF